MNQFKSARGLLAAAAAFAATGAALATDFPEVEFNDNKGSATVVTGMQPGDTLSGNSQGTTADGGATSVDYFDVSTAPAPAPGIYRYRLVITTTGTAGHTGTIRGLTQTAGVINPGTDTAIQTSSASSSPPRFVQWYANEGVSRLYFRVAGTASTLDNYTVTLERTPVTPSTVPAAIDAGPFFITTIGQTSADTDLWIFNSGFAAIPGATNDDESTAGGGTGATLQSRLQRNLPAGTYIAAIANYNLATDLPMPSDEDGPADPAADFPNVLLTSSTTTSADNDFVIGNRCLGSPQTISNSRSGLFEVTFWQFTLTGPQIPDPVTFSAGTATPSIVAPGASTTLSVTVASGAPTSVTANLSAFGLSAATPMSDPEADGTWTYALNVPAAQATGAYVIAVDGSGGACPGTPRNINLTVAVPPTNDECSGATVITSVPFSDTVATNAAADDADVSCNAAANTSARAGIWYRYTPAEPGRFSFVDSSADDVIFTVYTGDCAGLTEVFCNTNETGTVTFQASAGTTYFIMSSMNSATDAVEPARPLTINYVADSGACCNGSTCTITAGSAACTSAGGTFLGYNVSCGGGPLAQNINSSDIAIPEYVAASGPQPINSTINVTDTSVITDLDVYVTLTHTFSGDLYFRLQGPNGVTVDLFKRARLATCSPGATGDADDFNGTYIFDDEASMSIHDEVLAGPNPIPSGRYRSASCNGALTSLDAASPTGFGGIAANGTWTLIVSDEDEVSTGTLQEFGLVINGVEQPTACSDQTGACCTGTTCTVGSQAACSGSFQGAGTVCGPAGNPTTCCAANFNRIGQVTVQDIYDFLSDWSSQIGGGPVVLYSADVNGSGVVTVQDIYDFLSLWSAGCPG